MRWMQATTGDRRVAGTVQGDTLHVHTGMPWDGTAAPTGEQLPLAGLTWLPPCEPRQVLGLWNNFRAAAAKNGWAEPADPLVFGKLPSSATGHGSVIPAAPPEVGRVAYEGELGVVIGRRTHRIAREEAGAHIFGYTCANDVTAIELLHRDASFAQWTRAKSLPGFCAFGPWIDTGFDPAAAHLRTRVAGRERQNYALGDMFFSPQDVVWRLSQELVLLPGDLILCGTSLGVLPMKPGSEVEVEIDGLGCLRNTYGEATASAG
jgi:2-keto-4-pentenoate hydratase/2-oxohepta-3-ene-1,7-dioic acid hydratase in catechol pathway